MIDRNCKTEEVLIKTNGENTYLLKDLYTSTKKSKLFHPKKINSKTLKYEILSREGKEAFINELSVYICNGCILTDVLSHCQNQSYTEEMVPIFVEAFYENMQNQLAYFHLLSEINLKNYFKTNDLLDIENYWKYNYASLRKELKTIMNDKYLLTIVESKMYEKINEDEETFLKSCEKFRNLVERFAPNDIIDNFHMYLEDGVLLIEDDNQVLYSSVSFPEESLSIIDIDKLEPKNYVLLMILAFRPKNVFIYGELALDLDEEVSSFYENNIELFEGIELYFSEDDYSASH